MRENATGRQTEPTLATGPTQGTFTTAAPGGSWAPKIWTARAVSLLLHGGPIVLASLLGLLVARLLPTPHGFAWIPWLVMVVGSSQLILRLTERAVRQLLPLSYLFRFSLVFPDQAPSRFSMALRSGNVQKLAKQAEETAQHGLPAELGPAAQQALSMVTALNRHDRGTRGHCERVRAYADMLADELNKDKDFRDRLRWGALLHDMGKLTVPPEILNKPGKPTQEEWKVLAAHPAEGERILLPLAGWLGDAFFAAGQHHERWDGKGYPSGLQGEEISESARIVAVADAFAVMTGTRSYKKPLPLELARQELTKNAGTQFDPEVVRAMLNISISRVNRAAGPIAALANLPYIGSLLSAAPSVTASVAPTAAAAVLTAAALINPSFSPLEWASPSPPRELAFNVDTTIAPVPTTANAPAGLTTTRSASVSTATNISPTTAAPLIADDGETPFVVPPTTLPTTTRPNGAGAVVSSSPSSKFVTTSTIDSGIVVSTTIAATGSSGPVGPVGPTTNSATPVASNSASTFVHSTSSTPQTTSNSSTTSSTTATSVGATTATTTTATTTSSVTSTIDPLSTKPPVAPPSPPQTKPQATSTTSPTVDTTPPFTVASTTITPSTRKPNLTITPYDTTPPPNSLL